MTPVSAPASVGPRPLASAAVLLVGSLAYALLVGGGVVGFDATPLILGIIVVVAGLVGTRHRVTATGLVLTGWGTAVLLVDHGVVAGERTTATYMLGVGAGLLAAALAAPRADRGDWLTSASVTAFTAPLALFLVPDMATLGRWPLWSIVLLGWAAWEAAWVWQGRRPALEPAPS